MVQKATPRPKTRVCFALLRLYDPDPVAPALGGLGVFGQLSIVSFDTHFSLPQPPARAKCRHLAIYSEDIGVALLRTLL
ncbi:hypothetical protein Syun_020939 [Stephania yunnanensis]|uniref:Uncharacterized protein n=1 Tax=Stephania yunnanensis TaxID=152371 RepID=A0AAP0NNP8_9MAGN